MGIFRARRVVAVVAVGVVVVVVAAAAAAVALECVCVFVCVLFSFLNYFFSIWGKGQQQCFLGAFEISLDALHNFGSRVVDG